MPALHHAAYGSGIVGITVAETIELPAVESDGQEQDYPES